MIIRIEKTSGVPITRQIIDQIRTQCAAGALQAGDQLPSVRELARELAVNQNTILRVYERLEAEGLIERRHGAGTFVTEKARGNPMRLQQTQLRQEAEAFVRHALALDLTQAEAVSLIKEVCRDLKPVPSERKQEK